MVNKVSDAVFDGLEKLIAISFFLAAPLFLLIFFIFDQSIQLIKTVVNSVIKLQDKLKPASKTSGFLISRRER